MIIDIHTHVFPIFFRDRRETFFAAEPDFEILYSSPKAKLVGVRALLEDMAADGVDRTVIFGFPWLDPEYYRRHNDYVLEAVQRYPDRLVGFGCFSPLAPGAAREAERCLAGGLAGIGELAIYGARGLDGEATAAMGEVMAVCESADVPLLLHANEPIGHAYPGKTPMTLHQLDAFLRAYPANRIILAHWGGGLFFYALLKKKVREVLANVWVDTAASPFLYEPRIYSLAAELLGHERILLGSDYPLLKPQRYFSEIAAAGLPPEAVDAIQGGNAARLLGMAQGA